jgi:guanidinopropionase
MFDRQKLECLRAKFGDAGGNEIFDSHFRAVADSVFKDSDKRPPPYAGVPTLLRAPFRPDFTVATQDRIDIALLGVPMDLGVTNRSGARFGPRAVRNVERVGTYEHVLRMAPVANHSVADIGDVPLSTRYDLAACHKDIEAFVAALVSADIVPLSVGGDHSISLPLLRAVGKDRPVGMIQIDAHCDTSGSFEGCKFHHGGPFRQAVLDGVLDPERTIQIGIRGNADYLWEFSYDSGMTVIHAEEAIAMGPAAIVNRIREVTGDGPTYVTFDVDGLDPAFAPGTGTPEVGGLSSADALAILRGCLGLDVVGGDVVEVAPQYDPTTNTAQVAAQVLFAVLCLAAAARQARGAQAPAR